MTTTTTRRIKIGANAPRCHHTILLALVVLSYLQCFSSFAAASDDDATDADSFKRQRHDFLVTGLEKIEPAFGKFDGRMYAGLVPTTPQEEAPEFERRKGGQLMFWLFAPHAPTVNDTLLIWMNGGPGCSSLAAGNMYETGPVTTPPHPAGYIGSAVRPPLVFNPFAWTNATMIMYIEQPVGTGYTSGPAPENEEDLSQDFYYFLQNFLDIFPELRSKRLFLFGESYAGMYVPSIARYIYRANRRVQNENLETKLNTSATIQLAGIALGNGWIDVRVQGPATIDYAWWHGMIDSVTRNALHEQWRQCYPVSKVHPPFHHFTVPDECGIMEAILSAGGGDGLLSWGTPNTYDVTTFDPYPVLYDDSLNGTFGGFFNNPLVKEALHAPADTYWQECIPGEGRRRQLMNAHLSGRHRHAQKLMLDEDEPISVVPYIAELLDVAHISVLIYNGDRDMSCCAQGSEMLLDSMKWKGSKGWIDPDQYQRGLWLVEQQPDQKQPGDNSDKSHTTTTSHQDEMAGYAKILKNLTFLVVYNSGHLVPTNQPRNALDLATRFLRGESFIDAQSKTFSSAGGAGSIAYFDALEEGDVQKESQYLSQGGIWVALVAGAFGFVFGVVFASGLPSFKSRRQQLQYERINDH